MQITVLDCSMWLNLSYKNSSFLIFFSAYLSKLSTYFRLSSIFFYFKGHVVWKEPQSVLSKDTFLGLAKMLLNFFVFFFLFYARYCANIYARRGEYQEPYAVFVVPSRHHALYILHPIISGVWNKQNEYLLKHWY